MDPLTALATVAAVVQFADIGGRLLMKSWRKYRERQEQEESNDDGSQWANEAELEDALKELSLITRTIRGSTDHVVSHATNRTAETRLLQLCRECERIAEYFQEALKAAKKRRSRKVHERAMAGEDSRQTKKWEGGFNMKLNEILLLLKRIEDSATEGSMPGVESHNLDWLLNLGQGGRTDFGAGRLQNAPEQVKSHMLRGSPRLNLPDGPQSTPFGNQPRPTEDLVHIVSHLVASDNTKIWDRFKGTLDTDRQDVGHVHKPLASRTRPRDWQLKPTVVPRTEANVILTPLEPEDCIEAMTDGLRFETLHARQEAIPQNFQSTYHWIFDRQPKRALEGPLWQSFPNWLEGASESVYWVTGKPGSGKSTMMKYIAGSRATTQYLQKWSRPLPVLVVSYYAWIAGHSLQKSWDGLKRTMLHQALNRMPELITVVSPGRWALAQAHPEKQEFPHWQDWEVEECFNTLLRKCGRTVKLALFIDGLDEFDLVPTEVVRLINNLASISTDFLKICVASRPWTEFDDAFRSEPMVQMHLLTNDDTRLFVAGQLNRNQGFKEVLSLYPKQVEELKEEIVVKAQGVFLWVAVVVQSLLISFSEGEGLSDLQDTLRALPSDMNRRDASWMIQVVAAAAGPLEDLTLWLAEESRTTRINVEQLPNNVKLHAHVSLKRRLATRTRGILELTSGCVDFSHRTARDWAHQSEVWDTICSSYGRGLNPHLVLFEANTLVLSIPSRATEYTLQTLRIAITNTLWYASESSECKADSERLVEVMDFFDKSVQNTYERAQTAWPLPNKVIPGKQHWSSKQNAFLASSTVHNTFLDVAAQFSILPYIQIKTTGFGLDIPHLQTPKNGFSLLDPAMFGYEFFIACDPRTIHEMTSKERRLSTVKFLLEAGSKPGKDSKATLIDARREMHVN
ncbi:hypothetical protein PG994_007049 [Apiospora phragmitis]|uniref:Nephrocystin 3-like N-terminal domain-containing protein n=1 Tax=Apiospora phragmitis TaxID=2905665 RepID=A0ABR1UZM5_9PEZI